jgi:hypothetical protein
MTDPNNNTDRQAPLPLWAIVFTVLWLSIIAAAVWRDWTRFTTMPLNELGDFLAGFFAPIAFCWLVVGYTLQRHQITMSLDALAAEREAMLEERKMRLLSLHPRLSIRTGVSVKSSGNLRQTFHVRNFGGPTAETSVHVNAAHDGGLNDLGPMNQGEEKNFEWRFYRDREEVPVVISMRDSINTEHECTFTLMQTNDEVEVADVRNRPVGNLH